MNNLLEMNSKIQKEIEFNQQADYKLGSYLYMGMAFKKNKKVCISIGYTLNYCIKKADEYLNLDSDLSFCHISKIITGEKIACEKFYPEKLLKKTV
ncbi:MAG: hypothetical protein PHC38_00015 [Weeksellaceae bacterium]|nr:hypothetical protein [Weeksellaceae bacterium]